MTKCANGNASWTATAVPDLDRIEHRLDGLLQRFRTAPVPVGALADAIRALTGLQAELAASIAAPHWSSSAPRDPRAGRALPQETGSRTRRGAVCGPRRDEAV